MLKSRRPHFPFAIFFLFLGCAVASAQGVPADLDAWVTRSMKEFNVPGMAVAIVKDGKVVVAKGYGARKLGDATPVDESTMFGIGSNTKALTTAALATLVDEGKLSWDDPVYQRLPGFQMYDPYVAHEMTIRDLLTHRSGMGLGEGDLLIFPHTTYGRDEDHRAIALHETRFQFPQPLRLRQPALRHGGTDYSRNHRHFMGRLHPPAHLRTFGNEEHQCEQWGLQADG